MVNAIDLKGLSLGEAPFKFKSGSGEAEAVIDLPVEIRNDVARLEIVGERSAGAVQLLDKRWRRRTVGVVSGSTADRSQPLIGATYYLSRALNPFADVRLAEGLAPAEAVTRFLDHHLPMLILADVGNVTEARDRLNKWIDNGGVLVRFAGPHLAGADDDLVPVKLRRGGRILGGSLSWEKPQQLAAFSREGPFDGMAVPNDVTVTRQVLAEPDAQLTDRTWATLADGTPLVTAQRRGKGLLVLFHVTADTRWSDLPLSGAFVDMLRRIVALAAIEQPQRRRERRHRERRRPRSTSRAANARARRLRRVFDAAADGAPDSNQFQRARQPRSSARLLRTAGRPGRGQYAGASRPAGAARCLAAQRAHRRLPPRRAARSARPDLPRRARACWCSTRWW